MKTQAVLATDTGIAVMAAAWNWMIHIQANKASIKLRFCLVFPGAYGTYQPETRPLLAGRTMHSLCLPSWLRCTVQPSRSHRIKDLKSPS